MAQFQNAVSGLDPNGLFGLPPAPTYGQPPAQPVAPVATKPSWLKKNWKTLVIVLVLVAAVGGGVGYYLYWKKRQKQKESEKSGGAEPVRPHVIPVGNAPPIPPQVSYPPPGPPMMPPMPGRDPRYPGPGENQTSLRGQQPYGGHFNIGADYSQGRPGVAASNPLQFRDRPGQIAEQGLPPPASGGMPMAEGRPPAGLTPLDVAEQMANGAGGGGMQTQNDPNFTPLN